MCLRFHNVPQALAEKRFVDQERPSFAQGTKPFARRSDGVPNGRRFFLLAGRVENSFFKSMHYWNCLNFVQSEENGGIYGALNEEAEFSTDLSTGIVDSWPRVGFCR